MGASTNGDLQAQIDALLRQTTLNRSAIDALEVRIHASEEQALVDRDMIVELQRDGVLSQAHAAEMDMALKSSRTIGAAIGLIMGSRNLSEKEAFEVLRAASQNSNRKLRDLAADLVASAGSVGSLQDQAVH